MFELKHDEKIIASGFYLPKPILLNTNIESFFHQFGDKGNILDDCYKTVDDDKNIYFRKDNFNLFINWYCQDDVKILFSNKNGLNTNIIYSLGEHIGFEYVKEYSRSNSFQWIKRIPNIDDTNNDVKISKILHDQAMLINEVVGKKVVVTDFCYNQGDLSININYRLPVSIIDKYHLLEQDHGFIRIFIPIIRNTNIVIHHFNFSTNLPNDYECIKNLTEAHSAFDIVINSFITDELNDTNLRYYLNSMKF